MTKILVVGDSMTFGEGLTHKSNDPALWVNQLVKKTFDNYTLLNIADSGRNNTWIFTETVHWITQETFDLVIVGWSELARYNFHVGLELYSTKTMLANPDINVNPGVTFSGSWLENTGNRLRRFYNDHWSILDLVKYVNVLYNIQTNIKNKKIVFVNTLSKWSDQYFDYQKFTLPSDLSLFQQQMLQTETRDDDQIEELYNMIYQQYEKYGGIKEQCWLNLYQPLYKWQIDHASLTDRHPGYASQDIFVENLLPELHKRI
jgi:hypothetical protein